MITRLLIVPAFLVLFSPMLRGEHDRYPVQGSHFFLPSRTLFFFRPDLYVRLHSHPTNLHRTRRMDHGSSYRRTRPLPQRGHGVYRVDASVFSPSEIVQANTSNLIFQVNPSRALVYVDGRLIGSAGDFANEKSRYPIVDGEHVLRVEFPGYRPFETQMEVVANRTLNLTVELEPLTSDR